MDLTERKKKILRAVVESYIRTAEPVGSKAILELADLKVSSATIRNELSDLTEMGYLEQPHTSAGRVPSPKGYRLYVNELMEEQRLSLEETRQINDALHLKMQELDKVIAPEGQRSGQFVDKGIHPVTLEIICSFLREHKSEKLSIEDIAKNVSLSRVTLRRYMNYLIDKNSVIGGVDYSTGGRPSAVYTYIGK